MCFDGKLIVYVLITLQTKFILKYNFIFLTKYILVLFFCFYKGVSYTSEKDVIDITWSCLKCTHTTPLNSRGRLNSCFSLAFMSVTRNHNIIL